VNLFCAARIDGPEMWRSLAEGAVTLRAPEDRCRRFTNPSLPKCAFENCFETDCVLNSVRNVS
jgi:hypothetical protein